MLRRQSSRSSAAGDRPSLCIAPRWQHIGSRTDRSGWIMLFPAAAGLIVERGSLLSHSAIVSREMGIPAVVSVPGATRWLRDGDLVEIDGAKGIVRRLVGTEACLA